MNQEVTVLRKLFALLRHAGINPWYLMVPVAVSMTAAVFEGASLGMLIPILNGFLEQDFSFAKELPVLGTAINFLPESILMSDRLLFVTLLVIFVCAVILKNIFSYLSVLSVTYFSTRSSHHVRKVLFARYLSFGKLYFDRSNVGRHATVLSQIVILALAPLLKINKQINALFSIAVYAVVMMMISWKITLVALPLFILMYAAVHPVAKSVRSLSSSLVEQAERLGKKSVEMLSLVPLVKMYGTQDAERDAYAKISDRRAMLEFRTQARHELVTPMQELITMSAAILLFAGMLYLLVYQGEGTAPSFLVYFYVLLNASAKFGVFAGMRTHLAAATSHLDTVLSMFEDDEKWRVEGGSTDFVGLKKSIELKNLTFRYGDGDPVLQDVSLTIPKGKMTAIVGPSGSGKSTLIHLLMRFYDCPPSAMFVDGDDIRSYRISSLLNHMALVSQDTLLLHDTLRANVAYGLSDVSDEKIWHALERARLADYVRKLPSGLDNPIGDRGVQLSGGERQRLSIARALLKNAEILILDEATSSLDSRTERLIQEAIDEAVEGRTSIVIAHRLSTIQHADRIVVLEAGKMVEDGSLEELLARRGVFYHLWEEQKFS